MQTILNALNFRKIIKHWYGNTKIPKWWLRTFLPNWLVVFSTVTGLVLGALSAQGVVMAGDPGSYQSSPPPGSTLNIGGSTVGTPVSNSTLRVTNGGTTTALTISNASITGANAADFTVTLPPIPFSLAVGASQNVTIQCTPGGAGPRNAQLQLTTDDPNNLSPAYPLTCTGLVPAFSSVPAPGGTLNIGNVPVGSSATANIAVSNPNPPATGTLVVNGYGIGGPNSGSFLVTAPPAPFSVNVGQTVNIVVQCTPPAPVALTATLTITTNAPNPNNLVTYNLTCTGVVQPKFNGVPAPPGPLTMTSVIGTPSAPVNIQVNNTGSPGSNLAVTVNPPGAPFTAGPPALNILQGSPAQTIAVSCTPTMPNQAGTLTLNTNDPNLPTVTYNLVCVGQAPVYTSAPAPGATINITSPVGISNTATIDVTNTGNLNLNVNAPTGLGGPLTVAPNAPYSLVPAATQTVTITCTPATTATVTQVLSYVTNDPANNPVTYTVTCTGQVPVYSSIPAPGATININALVGNSNSANINVTNTGGATLTVSAPGGLSGVLSVSPNAGYNLPAAAGQTVTVTCTPATTGTVTQTLTYTTNDPTHNPVTYTINCIGQAPVYTSTPAPGATINITALVGGSNTATINVTNTGNTSLDVVPTSNLGGVLSDNPNVAYNLIAGASQTITLTCTPTSAAMVTQTLSYSTSDPNLPNVNYTVTCTGQGPLYTSTPAPGSTITIVAPLGSSNTATINVTNNGNQPLNVNAPGGIGGVLSVSPNAGYSLIPTASQVVTLTCTPLTTTPVTQTLTYTTNDPANPNISYTVICTGQGPTYSSTPAPGATINITAPVGTSNTSTINVTNTGPVTLTVQAPTGLVAPLSVAPNAVYNLAASASQTVTLTCTPATTATVTQTLSYSTNDPNLPTVTYTVTCTGVVPVYTSTPAPGGAINITAAVGSSNTAAINVTNTGGATLNVSAPAGLSGVLSVAPATAYSLGAAGTQVVTLTCTPTSTAPVTQTLTYTTNDTTKPTVTYTVTCTGVVVPVYSSSPVAPGGTINFGTSPVGTPVSFSLTIQNAGGAPLTVTLPAGGAITGPNAADFSLNPAGFPLTLGPAASQAVAIQCTPSASGARSATLSFNTNDPNRPAVTYTLSCTAPAPGSFGSSPVAPGGTIVLTSPGVGVTVSTGLNIQNSGASPFTINGASITGPNAAVFNFSASFPLNVANGGSAAIVILCTPSSSGVQTATLTLTTSLATLPQVTYTLQCSVNLQKRLPADLELQLTVSPDRQASNRPDNLITYSFKVKNIGPGRASFVYVVLPVDTNLVVGYTKFSHPKAWVVEVLATSVKIRLPDLETDEFVTGSIYFRPKTDPQPASGAKVSTRFTAYYDDATGTGWKRYSNAVNFSFTSGNNVSSGGVQWLGPTNQSGPAGSKLTYTAEFFAPDERVTGWLTKPDGKSLELTGPDRGRASAKGVFSLTVDTAGLLPGTYSLTIYGNKSQATGNASLVVTNPQLTPATSSVKVGARLTFNANFLAASEMATAWITGPDGKSHDLKKERATPKGEFSLALDTTGMAAGSYKVVVYGNSSTLKAEANLALSAVEKQPAPVQLPAKQPDPAKVTTPVTEAPVSQPAALAPANKPAATAPVPANDQTKAAPKVETQKFFQLLGSAKLKSGTKTNYTAEHLTAGERASAWITGPNGKSIALGSSYANAQGKYSLTLNTSGLAPGTYTVAVQGNSSQVVSSMVIVIGA
jgi:uncharacterized membrane protein